MNKVTVCQRAGKTRLTDRRIARQSEYYRASANCHWWGPNNKCYCISIFLLSYLSDKNKIRVTIPKVSYNLCKYM